MRCISIAQRAIVYDIIRLGVRKKAVYEAIRTSDPFFQVAHESFL
jgi:hypothetical protein